ncbi:MAG TPA: monofunctional biosynthetic peptidoglycan transglycosylase [Myxococcales bacterium]|nr:monofunctional biosynthetic peptidoglycan transglycosylase [Myxococcales bacterium]
MRARRKRRTTRSGWRWALVLALAAWVGYEAWTLPSGEELRALESETPAETALMRARKDEAVEKGRAARLARRPVRASQVAPAVRAALVASEDARFFEHEGFDLRQVHAALRASVLEGKRLRGASTLTQQLAKNLYLSESRSVLRKLKELWIAWRMERTLSKRRILELYLNVVEWGDGVFGIEAAARAHLKKSASQVDLAEAAALVAMLPNPHRIGPRNPRVLHRRALHVLERVENERLAAPAEIERARERLAGWLVPLSDA